MLAYFFLGHGVAVWSRAKLVKFTQTFR